MFGRGRIRGKFRQAAALVFWTSPLWAIPMLVWVIAREIMPPAVGLMILVGVISFRSWMIIRGIGFLAEGIAFLMEFVNPVNRTAGSARELHKKAAK